MSCILAVRWLKWGGTGMTRIPYSIMVIVPAVLAALGGAAISAQDKYTVQVPGGLAFSEFKGYEDWQTVSVSKTGARIRCDPRQSRDDRGLPGWRSRQRQAVPRGLQDRQGPLEAGKERGCSRSDDGSAGRPGKRRLYRKGQQAVHGPGQRRMGICRVQLRRRVRHVHAPRPRKTRRRRRTTPSAGSRATR